MITSGELFTLKMAEAASCSKGTSLRISSDIRRWESGQALPSNGGWSRNELVM